MELTPLAPASPDAVKDSSSSAPEASGATADGVTAAPARAPRRRAAAALVVALITFPAAALFRAGPTRLLEAVGPLLLLGTLEAFGALLLVPSRLAGPSVAAAAALLLRFLPLRWGRRGRTGLLLRLGRRRRETLLDGRRRVCFLPVRAHRSGRIFASGGGGRRDLHGWRWRRRGRR